MKAMALAAAQNRCGARAVLTAHRSTFRVAFLAFSLCFIIFLFLSAKCECE